MVTAEQRDAFESRGYVRLVGAFSRTDADAMEDRLWRFLAERQAVRRDDPSTWSAVVATGLQELKTDPIFDPIGGSTTTSVLDGLLGANDWIRPRQWGQFLVTFPPRAGTLDPFARATWHTDFELTAPASRPAGALVFSFLSDVPPESGGTAILEGSPRVIEAFVAEQPPTALSPMKRARKALLRHDPWLAGLAAATGPEWLERQLGCEHVIGGHRVRVAELTGAPGDVVVAHPWLLHAPAPNRATRPRFMRVQRVHVRSGG